MWQVPAVPARCPTDAAWLGAPVPTVPFTPPPPHRRWPPPHRRWPQPSDSAGSLSKCKGRREQRGEEDQSAEGGSVAKRIQVQKVAVAPAIPAAPSAAPCTQTPHTKRVGRRWARGGSRAGHMFPRPRTLNRLPFLGPIFAVGWPLDDPGGPRNQLKKSQKAGSSA